MTTVWFISDPHFGHRLMADLRGFESEADHDERICDSFVSLVNKRDTIWWLGDLDMNSGKNALPLIAKLPGTHHLVPGNHDAVHPMHRGSHNHQRRYLDVFSSVQLAAVVSIAGTHALLSHMPYSVDREEYENSRFPQWRLPDLGMWLVHGHTHSKEIRTGPREIHVGLDAWNLGPVDVDTIRRLMTQETP